MNKKAMMLLYPLLAAILIALSTFYFLSIQKSSEITVNYIGESSLDLLKASKKAENALFYIDQSAKFAVGQSINDLAQNGGYYKQSNCGQYIGYYFWQKEDKECYPAELNKNFKLILNENIDKYLEAYPEDIDLEIPEDNYEFTIYDNKLIGTAFSNIIVFIRNEQGTAIGKYSVKPSFSLGFDHDFRGYNKTTEQAKGLFIFCDGKEENELNDCVNKFIGNNNLNWKFKQLGKKEYPDVPNAEKVVLFDADNVRFGLQFS